jgi:two-component system, OmpR family, KDP operon response regulator KdpE
MKTRVLIVDDDREAASVLAGLLMNGTYEIRTAGDADAALACLREWGPSAIITDLQMPRVTGIELCRRARQTSSVPVIVLSGEADDALELAALDAGADDYLATPISTAKLTARLRAVLRRSAAPAEPPVLAVGDFAFDFEEHRVRLRGQPVRLTPKEFDLFAFMAKHPNRVLHHKTLLGAVWGIEAENQPEYLRVYVGQLRKKFESDPPNPRYVVTEPWVGYRFNPTGLMQ